MKISSFRDRFREQLQSQYAVQEIDSIFYLLTENYFGIKRLDLALDPSAELDENQEKQLETALERLRNAEPVQYLTGKSEFFGMDFEVSHAVLIPRPETEELVQWIIDDQADAHGDILDVGTGSGCIAIALAKNLPKMSVQAIDLSEAALEVASKNVENNQVSVQFRKDNILEIEDLGQEFDVIVSNPPYVRELEKASMRPNVLEHEPKMALYVEDSNALIFYHKIAILARKHLKKNGALYFEINQYLGPETSNLIQEIGFETELKKDIFGNDRMIKATFK
ncbi:peptide chain release factor N(5)-glutamine methyltransferase [Christiangramia flava]|uniref:Release factor glutamine methyltransferase n=1 Tax=Christiangramia flava JLT2011 TaxID=1229726 RepID=A0A1L7I0N0_9FLAO|nr:peptide chain release factor N(5)-glutamine methyltransferase [Christiangramia flava]APU67157.1 Methylase of polypeptide chain release factors [Christiangramia flava JLT2011]OSS38071.1 Methylase of polypeptide chain release factor [Christiangramia flava JLT2011]